MFEFNPDPLLVSLLQATVNSGASDLHITAGRPPTARRDGTLISFENVDHLSSAALGTLITINNKVKSQDGQLRLAAIDPQIYEVFVITKLNKLFQIYDTPDEAMKSFA